jgi:hypothetical protein
LTTHPAARATRVADRRDQADANARDATAARTGRHQAVDDGTTTPSSGTTPDIPTNTPHGPARGASGPADQIPTSNSSAKPSNESKRRWRQPRNAREFATQASHVATMILNGSIDQDTARLYVGAARVTAQAMSTNATVARFLGTEADLSLDDDMTEADTDG